MTAILKLENRTSLLILITIGSSYFDLNCETGQNSEGAGFIYLESDVEFVNKSHICVKYFCAQIKELTPKITHSGKFDEI